MKRKIAIHNVGPIKDVSLDLNIVNVFMGPQSSGKSTIAKLLSFCMWTDKEAILHQSVEFIDTEFVEKELFGFHKIRSYFSDRSSFVYESDVLSLEYKERKIKAKEKEGLAKARIGKVAYIPAERIIVSMPGIQSMDLPYNYLRSFVFDWLKTRSKYNSENQFVLDDMKQKYYFDEATGRDVIVLGEGSEIPFVESSSGIQSYVPLSVSLNYLTEWIYKNQEDISYEKKELIDNTVTRCFLNANKVRGGNLSESKFQKIQQEASIKSISKTLSQIKSKAAESLNPKDEFDSALSGALDLRNRISTAHYSDIVIEEPELNLFPEMQGTIIRDILRTVSRGNNGFIITTHSPYILYALNNYMLAWLVRDALTEAKDEELLLYDSSFINPEMVSVWEIKDGVFWPDNNGNARTIQDSDGLIRRNYFNQTMKEVMKTFNTLFGYYEKD